jgi:S1-C subfamily serine protease
VIEDADSITVQTVDGTKYEAKIHGPDPKTDLALIKIDATDLPTVVLGDSDAMKVGQFVMALGNPSGFNHTMNVGHISALGRFNISPTNRDFSQEDFIQTDAAIGLGMSGGPLVNISGEVVGISTLMAPFAQSLGFAVPINMAKEVLDELMEKGRVVRGYLGVQVGTIEYDVGSQYGLENDNGALVSEVMPGSPADEAGLQAYDVILEVGRKAVGNANELVRTVSRMKPGDETSLVIMRDKKELRLSVTLVEQPAVAAQEPAGAGRSPLDLVCRNLNDKDREELGVKTGVIVTEVTADGAASKGGILPKDVILEINRRPISTALQFYQALDDMETEGSISLMIHRDGRRLIRHIRLSEKK